MRNTLKNLTYLGFLTTVSGSQAYADTIPSLEERESNVVLDKTSSNTPISFSLNEVPRVSEQIVKERLKAIEGDIALPYSAGVMRVIEEYTIRCRHSTEELLMRSSFYFPIFEQILAKHNLPDELKYLAVIESNLKPEVKSYVAAGGLWQFMPSTGLHFGLAQNAYIDERVDPFKSTEAAAAYFQYLYEKLGDWHLVFAAYNCGEGAVLNAIRANGGNRDFEAVFPYLPAQTRAYLPKFVGMVYVLKYAEEHNIRTNNPWGAVPSREITTQGTVSLRNLAEQYNVPLEVIQRLNPHLKQGFIPESMSGYVLRVPDYRRAKKKQHTRKVAKAILAGKQDSVMNAQQGSFLQLLHPVRQGESLASIAQLYEVKEEELKDWNRGINEILHTNQQLVLWIRQRKQNLERKSQHTTG